MRPLKITAHMAEPVIYYGDSLHFDDLLAGARFKEIDEDLPDPNRTDWPVDFDLPLATWEAPLSGECHARLLEGGKIWGWRASAAQWGPWIQSSHAVRKMPDTDDFVRNTRDTGDVHESTGPLKAKDKTFPTRFSPKIWWYAVGDEPRISQLLLELTHLGKLRGHGMGRVRDWQIEQIDTDYSIVDEGRLMRRMPVGWCESEKPPTRGSIRPPYWHQSRRCDCYPRGTEVGGEMG